MERPLIFSLGLSDGTYLGVRSSLENGLTTETGKGRYPTIRPQVRGRERQHRALKYCKRDLLQKTE